jgi:transcriptional regulator with XRE-family HTH domain
LVGNQFLDMLVSAQIAGVNMNIGSRVKEMRLQRGWSQSKLSTLTGIAQPVLSQLEAKPERGCKAATAVSLADVFEVSVYWLITGRDDPYYNEESDDPFLIIYEASE